MQRLRSKIMVLIFALLGTVITPLVAATPASAHPICDTPYAVYSISGKSFTYYPTNVYSAWASFRKGGTINYSSSKTLTVSASVTATVSAEAGIVFAKASTSLGITVGGSYSHSKTWSYTANVPATTTYKYRLHAYRYAANFTVTKKVLNQSNCTYTVAHGYPAKVYHAPPKSSADKYIVWRLDKAKA
jgi:hypothetical protein